MLAADVQAEVDALLSSADDPPRCADPELLQEVALMLGLGVLDLAGPPPGGGSPIAVPSCPLPGLLVQPEFEPSPPQAESCGRGSVRAGRDLADALAAVAPAPLAPCSPSAACVAGAAPAPAPALSAAPAHASDAAPAPAPALSAAPSHASDAQLPLPPLAPAPASDAQLPLPPLAPAMAMPEPARISVQHVHPYNFSTSSLSVRRLAAVVRLRGCGASASSASGAAEQVPSVCGAGATPGFVEVATQTEGAVDLECRSLRPVSARWAAAAGSEVFADMLESEPADWSRAAQVARALWALRGDPVVQGANWHMDVPPDGRLDAFGRTRAEAAAGCWEMYDYLELTCGLAIAEGVAWHLCGWQRGFVSEDTLWQRLADLLLAQGYSEVLDELATCSSCPFDWESSSDDDDGDSAAAARAAEAGAAGAPVPGQARRVAARGSAQVLDAAAVARLAANRRLLLFACRVGRGARCGAAG